jgi:hypothetical protein
MITYAFRSGSEGELEIIWFSKADPRQIPVNLDLPQWANISRLIENQQDKLLNTRNG